MKHFVWLTLCLLGLYACTDKEKEVSGKGYNNRALSQEQVKGLFEYVDAKASGLNYINEMADSLAIYIFKYEYAYNGGGVAIGDINNDGLPDVYFSGTFSPNKLYLNLGNLHFRDITDQAKVNGGAGIKTGVNMVDINDDGLLDIYVCKSGSFPDPAYRANVLYINKGNLQFSEEGAKYGLQDLSYSTQSYFADFDMDGDLDMFLVNHPLGWDKKHALQASQDNNGQLVAIKDTSRFDVSDRLYINNNGRFVDRTFQYKVDNVAFGLSAMVFDANNDGYPDIYVANDYAAPDHLYINQGGKYFKDEVLTYFDNIPNSSMGCDAFDANNDGMLDLFVNDMMPEDDYSMKINKGLIKNYDAHLLGKKLGYHDQFRFNAFQINDGHQHFSNQAFMTGTSNTNWSWAALGEDFDHNGHCDLFITNGYLKDIFNMDYTKYGLDSLIKNVPKKDFSKAWNAYVKSVKLTNYFYANNGNMSFDKTNNIWSDGRASFSNGAAYADLDNDGDLDMVVNNFNEHAFLMKNTIDEKKKSQHVSVQLIGDKGNRNAIGAEVTAMYDDGSHTKRLMQPSRGFLSCVDKTMIIGYPENKKLTALQVKWPDRSEETFSVDQSKVTLKKGSGQKNAHRNSAQPLFVANSFPFQHIENEYIDFKREPLLQLENSSEGPCMAAGDVNGDGKEEIYIGGAHNQAGALFSKSGDQWVLMKNTDFELDKTYEDVAACMADVDKDNDIDLIVASGGYQWAIGDGQYQVRLYLNDGKGNLLRNKKSFPDVRTNAGAVVCADWDSDGSMEVFIGGGAAPGRYPNADRSILLECNKGQWQDITKQLDKSMASGIIKCAKAADINGDKKIDLITAGDYQPIRIYHHQKDLFALHSTIENSEGLWQCLLIEDFNGDGQSEIIAGNLGLNSFMVADDDNTAAIYSGDFDGNGEHDAIHCINREGQPYPVHAMDELLQHMTTMRKKFLRYHQYANQSPEAIFGDKIDKATTYKSHTFATSIFYKKGEQYLRKNLPNEAQVSMVRSLATTMIEGQKYLVGVGNFYDTNFIYGKYDASKGFVLKVNKDLTFESMKNSGLTAYGNVRSMVMLNDNSLVVGTNNGMVRQWVKRK